jgi:hypothetical protein
MSRNVAQCRAMSSNVKQCRAMSRNVAQCRFMLLYVALCHFMSRNVAQCRAMLSNVVQCRAMSSNVKQCRAMLRDTKQNQSYLWRATFIVRPNRPDSLLIQYFDVDNLAFDISTFFVLDLDKKIHPYRLKTNLIFVSYFVWMRLYNCVEVQ